MWKILWICTLLPVQVWVKATDCPVRTMTSHLDNQNCLHWMCIDVWLVWCTRISTLFFQLQTIYNIQPNFFLVIIHLLFFSVTLPTPMEKFGTGWQGWLEESMCLRGKHSTTFPQHSNLLRCTCMTLVSDKIVSVLHISKLLNIWLNWFIKITELLTTENSGLKINYSFT